ncbi:MAG: TetR/AcrR family transcriptional regulator [Acidobacteriota bacterium]|nr:TetR/AcrR family transcriptional regulator [Acidobacteriota bacterium]
MDKITTALTLGKSAPKRSRSEGRKAQLTQIAYQLLADGGLENFRTRMVASAAGIDLGTLHYHFPSKQSLIQAVLDHLVADFRVNRAKEAEWASPMDELRGEIRDVALRVRQSPEQFRLLIDLRLRSIRDEQIAAIFTKLDQRLDEVLVDLLRRGVEHGAFRADLDPRLTARVLRTEMIGLSLWALQISDGVEEIASALGDKWAVWLSQ